MTTNTQPQTQGSGGDELDRMLKAFQHDVAATGYPMNTPGQDDLLAGATEVLRQYIRACEREAVDKKLATLAEVVPHMELTETDSDRILTWVKNHRWSLIAPPGQNTVQPKPQAGEGGEG